MYRKLRIRVALTSVAVLLLLFLGTIAIVYATSYRETMRMEQEMLSRYAEAYWENGNPEGAEALPPISPPPGEPLHAGLLRPDGQFWSVEMDETGAVAAINNPDSGTLTDEELTLLAQDILAEGRADGACGLWVYCCRRRDRRALVALIDMTLFSDSSSLLLRNTLRYGAMMVVILCAAAWFSSGLLVRPMERSDREQRRFLSDAGHELKTPVAVIATNAELLKRQIGDNRWLDNIIAENARSGELVLNLLALTRTREAQSEQTRLNLSALAQSVVLPFEAGAYEKGHPLKSELQEGIVLSGNARQLASLISILLDNAIAYSAEGMPIEIRLKAQERRAVLCVSNRCAPMTQAECERMFDRFYRNDPSRTGDGHYGLGLSIARRIVMAHRGSIGASWKDGAITIRAVFPMPKAGKDAHLKFPRRIRM